MKLEAKGIAEIGIVGALYAVLVFVFAPISFAQFQFRIAEVLKPMVIRKKHLIWAIGLGNLVGNLISGSYAGYLELTLMPITCVVWGYICWLVGNKLNVYIGSFLYAFGTSLSVGWMLSYVFGIPFVAVFTSVLVSETILIVGGTPFVLKVLDALEKK
ncbi:MAG: QueT transporter family protein [Candidatus Methanofastidiosia archaeon]